MARRGRAQVLAGLRPLLLYSLVLAAPLAALLVIAFATDDELEGVAFMPEPVVVPVTTREVRGTTPVSITLTWSEGQDLASPGWQGRVTALYIAPGQALRSGQKILAVDGVDRVAFATAQPFFRKLKAGDSGADVELLNLVLGKLGFLAVPSGETFTFNSSLAVRDFESWLGVARPTGEFDPAHVVFLPLEPFVVDELKVTLGSPAPPTGQAIATQAGQLTKAVLAPTIQGGGGQAGPIAFRPGQRYVLVLGGTAIPMNPPSLEVPAEGLDALEPLVARSRPASPGQPAAPGAGASAPTGSLQFETPIRSLAVPSAAIMVNADGQTCAWIPSGESYRAVAVEVVDSRLGVSDVVAGLQAGDRVLANPAEILASPTCPSN